MTSPLPPDENQRLLRLLRLKRYEVPPPGFFDQLPRRVLLSVRAGTELRDRPWWEWARDFIFREPMVAGSYAALGLGALLFGVSVFETARGTADLPPVGLQGSLDGASAFVNPSPASLPSGVIYRVVPLPVSRDWPGADRLPLPLNRFERIDGRSETAPVTIHFSLPR